MERLPNLSNGESLKLAKDEFDVFITVDQNLEYQQALQTIQAGQLVRVESGD